MSSPRVLSPHVVLAKSLTTNITTTTTIARRMVSKDCTNDKNDDEELKKGKSNSGYASARDPEQERL